MGMDVMNGNGVIANVEQMIGILKEDKQVYVGKNIHNEDTYTSLLWQMCDVIDRRVLNSEEINGPARKKDDVPTTMHSAWEVAKQFVESIRKDDESLEPTWQETIQALKKAATVEDGGDGCFLPAEEPLLGIWNDILEFYPDLPQLQEVRAFSKGRLEGYDVPIGEACFIFGPYVCFEKSLTKKGKALKKAIGHCDESEWTTVSY